MLRGFLGLNVCLSVCCHVSTLHLWLYLFIIRGWETFFRVFEFLRPKKGLIYSHSVFFWGGWLGSLYFDVLILIGKEFSFITIYFVRNCLANHFLFIIFNRHGFPKDAKG